MKTAHIINNRSGTVNRKKIRITNRYITKQIKFTYPREGFFEWLPKIQITDVFLRIWPGDCSVTPEVPADDALIREEKCHSGGSTMNGHKLKQLAGLLAAFLLVLSWIVPAWADGLYGLAAQKLATRNGPGTTYDEKGTYNVAGQYIKVLSRAWDSRNGIWWVKCEIPYRGEIRVLWTGYKRFDSSTLPLESIPIDSKYPGGGKTPTAAPKKSTSSGGLYGLAKQKLATRSGPGTTYDEKGTYNVAGQYIRVLSRAWDSRNSIWWVKCEIPYRGEIRVLWTGYKRFDSSTLPLESIPVEGQQPVPQPQNWGDWNSVYRSFVTYETYLASNLEYYNTETSGWYEIAYGLYDMDRNGIPELIISNGEDSMAGRANHVYTFSDGEVKYLGEIGFRESELFYAPGSAFPGLFCSDGNMGSVETEYYFLSGLYLGTEEVLVKQYYSDGDPYTELSTPIVKRLTNNTALYRTSVSFPAGTVKLTLYTKSGIQQLGGWENFVKKMP